MPALLKVKGRSSAKRWPCFSGKKSALAKQGDYALGSVCVRSCVYPVVCVFTPELLT